jgi:hypothetical protein
MENYIYICVYNKEDDNEDFRICESCVVKTNGEYTLSFNLDSDGDGVIDSYHFYDVKSKVSGYGSGPWDFEEFTDADDEYTEHKSLEDFNYDSDEIGRTFERMRSEFTKKYLNEESQSSYSRLLDKAAVPFNKRNILTEKEGLLIFEEGDRNLLPPAL